MGSAFHQLCPRYSGTLTPTAPTAIRLWDTFTFLPFLVVERTNYNLRNVNDVSIVRRRNEIFSKSFIPSTIDF